ncbi:MAG TPA: hypothetical protein PKD86_00365 [Gemmatales bacterium]|nr:hypothetical protein [Gemmatales bacterium]
MRATLWGGHQVDAFTDYYQARSAGLLSRSSWRRSGRIVPDNTVPAGIVVKKSGKVRKDVGAWVDPVLGEDGAYIICTDDWYPVFRKDQAIPKDTSTETEPISNKEEKEEEPRGKGSLMTQKASETPQIKGYSTTDHGSRTPSVNSVRAYVPEGLTLPDNCPVKEQIFWFLGLLYWKHLEQREPWEKPINLMYDFLKDNIPQWPEVWRWCDARFVERTAGYTPGDRSYGYWTALPYREQTHRLRTFEHKLLAKRQRTIERKHKSRPLLIHLRKQLDRLSVDMSEFEERFWTHPHRHYYEAHLRTILDGELRLTQDDFSGRVHTNVSNMYKPLRSLLRVDGERDTLGETDIKNSQPLFLGLAAKRKGVEDRSYLRLCEAGEIYDHLARRLGVLRESAKLEMVTFLYAKNGYRSTAKALFDREFPAMAAFVRQVKEKDHKRLARHMQEAERKFVLDTVCERLRRMRGDMFITTIHDALVARRVDCDLVVSVMKEEFARLGVHPRLEWRDVNEHSHM